MSDWMPCNEKLPDRYAVYIVTRASYDDENFVDYSISSPSTQRWTYPDVIAWIPIPRPWHKGDSNNE